MKIKTIIPFIIILALLVGVVVWQKVNEAPPAPIATQIGLESLVPEGMQKQDIARIELFSGEQAEDKVVLERDGDDWRVASLYDAPANATTIEAFIDKLLGLKGEPRANADTDARLADFALTNEEAFHVRAYRKEADTPAMDILFGKSADFRTVFLRKAGGSRVFVESANLRREAGVSDSGEGTIPTATKWLQTTLLELDDDGITQVALNYPDKELVFTRETVVVEPEPVEAAEDDEDEPAPPAEPEVIHNWVLSQGGFSADVKEQEVKNLLTRFANVAVTNVADPERKADWGFDPPRFSVTISREGAEDVVLYGGRDKPGGDTYIQLAGSDPELIYQISKFNFEQIFLQGSKLFTLPEWTLDKDAIQAVSMTGPQGNIALVREEDTWRVTEPQLSLEAQRIATDNLVSAAASLKPVDYADADAQVGPFDTTITLSLGDDTTRTLRLGPASPNSDGRYVMFDDSDAILVLARTDVEKLAPPVRDLFVLSLFQFETDAVSSIHVSGPNANLDLARSDEVSVWSGTFNGADIHPDLMQVEEFIFGLNDFQVDNFMLDREPASVQAESVIRVGMKDGSQTEIAVSAESDGVYEMAVSTMPYVFTVNMLQLMGIIDGIAGFADLAPVEPEPVEESADETEEPPAEQPALILPGALEGADAAETPAEAVEMTLDMPVAITDVDVQIVEPDEQEAPAPGLIIE